MQISFGNGSVENQSAKDSPDFRTLATFYQKIYAKSQNLSE